MGDFVSSGHTLDQALAQSPAYGRAREVRRRIGLERHGFKNKANPLQTRRSF